MARRFDDRPVGAAPVLATSGVVAAGNAIATVPAIAGKLFYLEGYDIQGGGATAASIVTATLTGLGTTKSDIVGVVAGVTLANPDIFRSFYPPLEAAVAGVACVLTVPSLGTGNTKSVCTIYGYYK